MTAKVISFSPALRTKRRLFEPQPKPLWLLDMFKRLGVLQDAYLVWHTWPTLEDASYILARFIGPDMKTHTGKCIVEDVFIKAINGFKNARMDGNTINGSALIYVDELAKAGEMFAANRYEALGEDPEGEVDVWVTTRGPYPEWVKCLPAGYKVAVTRLQVFDGEFEKARILLKGYMLTASDLACLVLPTLSATRGDF